MFRNQWMFRNRVDLLMCSFGINEEIGVNGLDFGHTQAIFDKYDRLNKCSSKVSPLFSSIVPYNKRLSNELFVAANLYLNDLCNLEFKVSLKKIFAAFFLYTFRH